MSSDCEVCLRIMKEKHRLDFVWKIICVLLLATTIIFCYLYFGSGAMITETDIQIGNDNSIGNTVNGDGNIYGDSNIVIGDDNAVTTGTTQKVDYTPIIVITAISMVALLMIGGIIYANFYKKNSDD